MNTHTVMPVSAGSFSILEVSSCIFFFSISYGKNISSSASSKTLGDIRHYSIIKHQAHMFRLDKTSSKALDEGYCSTVIVDPSGSLKRRGFWNLSCQEAYDLRLWQPP
mmetsp:Transcript_5774/g.20446  ORF Transcript_5774/g.20446 Transcript_5774/m.20446 type:complete len:108 (-) Transcript_5774:369-692(-)